MLRRCIAHFGVLVVLALAQILAARDNAVSQKATPDKTPIMIPRLDRAPKLQQFLGMKPTADAPRMARVGGFLQYQPKNGAAPDEKTEVYIGYDSKDLYIVWVCFDKTPGKIHALMKHREDLNSSIDDTVSVFLDTFHDHRRAYGFETNPKGAQLDYIWSEPNGEDDSWDSVWYSSAKLTSQGYVAMESIPFKSIRFPKARTQTWGIILYRAVPHDNEKMTRPYVSIAVQGLINQDADLIGLHDIDPGRGFQLNPYAVAGAFRALDQRDPNNPFYDRNHLGGTTGLDGKMIIHDSLVLDFTVNPDFRQLESDQPQNTVNQRFEVFFPEKRPFFQEGANFFSTPINLYFTRRIENPFAGLRLTGKLGDYGIGLLAIDDRGPGRSVPDDDPLRRKRAYFTVARVTREFWKNSSAGFFYSDREMSPVPPADSQCQNNAVTTTDQTACVTNSNRVGGADFTVHMGSHLQAQGQAVMSTNDEADGTHLAGNLLFFYGEYSTRHIELNTDEQNTTSGFVTLTGFFQRPDIIHESQFGRYLWRPEGKILTDYGPQVFHSKEWDHEGNRLTWVYEPGFNIDLRASTSLQYFHGFTREQVRPFDFPQLANNLDFGKGYNGFFISNSYFKFVTFNGVVIDAKTINFDPPGSAPPFLTDETSVNLTASVHPWSPLSIDNSYILERLTTRTAPVQAVVNAYIVRSKWNYQYNPQLSFRTIFQFNDQLVNPLFTSLDVEKSFNTDFLVSYLVHPGTAFYLGYNSNLENLDPFAITNRLGLIRTNRSYINDGRTIFAKVSWLFRY